MVFSDDLFRSLNTKKEDELEKLKSRAGLRIRWAREAFGWDYSDVGCHPDFREIFGRTYERTKFKKTETGDFGKKPKMFPEFLKNMAAFYHIPVDVFLCADFDADNLRKIVKHIDISPEYFMKYTNSKAIFQEIVRMGRARKSEDTAERKNRSDWGAAPDISVFYGRQKELDALIPQIREGRCRILAITGIRGVGKTRFSVKLARELEKQFDYVIWRSLFNPPRLEELLTDLVCFLSDHHENVMEGDTEKRILRLTDYLRNFRCLILLDNGESLLQGGGQKGYREEYRDYSRLFTLTGELAHQSCLILTSREKTPEILMMSGENRPVRILELGGMDEKNGRKIFGGIGSFTASEPEWAELIRFYNGNPLALELTAKHIEQVYHRDVSEFLTQGRPVFDDIRNFLDWHYERLSQEEIEILFWMAINREPLSLAEIREDLVSVSSRKKLASTVQSLRCHLPLETVEDGFMLQPVLSEYFTEKFISRICAEIVTKNICFFHSHALLKATAKDYIRSAQLRYIVRPLLDELSFSPDIPGGLTDRLYRIPDMLRETPLLKNGYAGGNILNLLCHMEPEVKEADFSRICIRQAYLHGVQLRNVCFAHAEIQKSVFTQTFGSIMSLAFSPDGKFMAIADAGRVMRLWQTEPDYEPVLTFQGHSNWIRSIAFSPDGKMLASGSEDKTARIWDTRSGQCITVLESHQERVQSVSFGKEGKQLATGSYDGTVGIWDTESGECLRRLEYGEKPSPVHTLSFSPDGMLLAGGGEDRNLKLWDTESGKCLKLFNGHRDRIRTLAFSSCGKRMASGSDDGEIRIWRTDQEDCVTVLKGHANRIRSVTFSPDDKLLASSGEDQSIRLWELSSGQCIHNLKKHINRVRSIVFSPDGKTLFSGSDDQSIRKWNVKTGHCLNSFRGYSNFIRFVMFLPDGNTLVSSSQDRVIRIWDIRKAECVRSVPVITSWVHFLGYTGKRVIAMGTSGKHDIFLWDIPSARILKTLKGHSNWIRAIATEPGGSRIASCSDDGSVKLWEITSGRCIRTFDGHRARVCTVGFSPDGRQIVSGGYDGCVRIWDAETGNCQWVLDGQGGRIYWALFSPDNLKIAVSSRDLMIRIWDIRNGECLLRMEGHKNWIRTLSFSPDSRYLVSGSEDHSVRIWDAETGECLKNLRGHSNWINSVACHPDGHILASGGDQTIRIWEMESGECIQILHPRRPYEGTDITGIRGLTEARKEMLKELGAVCCDTGID